MLPKPYLNIGGIFSTIPIVSIMIPVHDETGFDVFSSLGHVRDLVYHSQLDCDNPFQILS